MGQMINPEEALTLARVDATHSRKYKVTLELQGDARKFVYNIPSKERLDAFIVDLQTLAFFPVSGGDYFNTNRILSFKVSEDEC